MRIICTSKCLLAGLTRPHHVSDLSVIILDPCSHVTRCPFQNETHRGPSESLTLGEWEVLVKVVVKSGNPPKGGWYGLVLLHPEIPKPTTQIRKVILGWRWKKHMFPFGHINHHRYARVMNNSEFGRVARALWVESTKKVLPLWST